MGDRLGTPRAVGMNYHLRPILSRILGEWLKQAFLLLPNRYLNIRNVRSENSITYIIFTSPDAFRQTGREVIPIPLAYTVHAFYSKFI